MRQSKRDILDTIDDWTVVAVIVAIIVSAIVTVVIIVSAVLALFD